MALRLIEVSSFFTLVGLLVRGFSKTISRSSLSPSVSMKRADPNLIRLVTILKWNPRNLWIMESFEYLWLYFECGEFDLIEEKPMNDAAVVAGRLPAPGFPPSG